MLTPREVTQELDHHRLVFLGVEAAAVRCLHQGRYQDAAGFAQLAAGYAFFNHAGMFARPRLEAVVTETAVRALPPARWAPPRGGGPPFKRILHVMTQAEGVGGHARFALRWVQNDESRSHDLVLTRQRAPLPPALQEAIRSQGGRLRSIRGGPRRDLVARAAELRQLLSGYDAAVLYLHPYDVVSLMALAGPGQRPPTVFVNHADHAFWLGTSVADLVACIRETGIDLCVDRRRVPRDRCVLLPIPMEEVEPSSSQEAAKRELGLPSTAVVLVSVATAYKYEPIDDFDFLKLVTPVLATHPNAVLVAVGPHGPRWAEAGRELGGRIVAPGPQADLKRFYDAADVYLDSYPVSSVTSLLEAGSLGVPVVRLRPYRGEEAVLCANDPALKGLSGEAADAGTYTALLSRLVEDPEHRARVGSATRDAVAASHAPRAWRIHVESVYRRLAAMPPAGGPACTEGRQPQADGNGRPTVLDHLLVRTYDQPIWHPGLFTAVHSHVDSLPRRTWPRAWAQLVVDRLTRQRLPRTVSRRFECSFVRAAARGSFPDAAHPDVGQEVSGNLL